MTTKQDLMPDIARRVRDTGIAYEEIDLLQGEPRVPDYFGISDPTDELNEELLTDTICDPSHHIWTDYETQIDSFHDAMTELGTILTMLQQDGMLEIYYPYGRESDIVYLTIDMDTNFVECPHCYGDATVATEFETGSTRCYEVVTVTCTECDKETMYEQSYLRQ